MSQPARARSVRTAPRTATGPVAQRRTGPVTVRPQLRVVEGLRTPPVRQPARAPGPQRRSRRVPFALLVVGLLVVTTLSLLALNTAIAVDSLHTTRQEAANKDLQQRVDRLEQQVVDGGTTSRLAQRAAAQGLVPAGVPGHLVVNPDGTATVTGDATPAPTAAPTAAPATGSAAGSTATGSAAAPSTAAPSAAAPSAAAPSTAAPSTAAPSTAGPSSADGTPSAAQGD